MGNAASIDVPARIQRSIVTLYNDTLPTLSVQGCSLASVVPATPLPNAADGHLVGKASKQSRSNPQPMEADYTDETLDEEQRGQAQV